MKRKGIHEGSVEQNGTPFLRPVSFVHGMDQGVRTRGRIRLDDWENEGPTSSGRVSSLWGRVRVISENLDDLSELRDTGKISSAFRLRLETV
jgi:trans-2-enoyl-CoA reductase